MAQQQQSNISINGQNYQNTGSFNLSALRGTGANTGRYLNDVTGVLVELRPRDGFYEFNGQARPNSWTAVFADGSLFSWPTYIDKATNTVMPWSRFDESIDLGYCAANNIAIHLWRDERKFTHLELADGQPQVQVNQSVATMANMTMANRQPGMQQPQMGVNPNIVTPF